MVAVLGGVDTVPTLNSEEVAGSDCQEIRIIRPITINVFFFKYKTQICFLIELGFRIRIRFSKL